ncbi:hypothetical protein WN944_023548 [Citrus x changshan-huyou]|uniref:Uncharacterized protein n=1 Tax=Citrus x changshan-huyou TaxID=2935761 RepID=A0AAP0N302_9ROSI
MAKSETSKSGERSTEIILRGISGGSEENFLKKFVLSFEDDAEELFHAYKGHKLGSFSGDQLLQ